MSKILALLLLLLALTCPSPALATTYYVSPTGSDTASGTGLTTPFKTISKGVSSASAGDTVLVRQGTYSSIYIAKSGTASSYITIAGYSGERPLITGSEPILLKGASYIKVSNFEVKGATAQWGAGIRVYEGGYNILESNLVHDNTGTNTSGIIIDDSLYNKVVGNEVYNNYFSGIQVRSQVSGQSLGNEITNNKSYNNTLSGGNSDGIKLEGGGTKNTLVSGNIVYGNGDDGIDTWNSSGNTLIGNTVYDQLGPGDGNGFKLGGFTTDSSGDHFGGGNIVKGNTAYGNKYNGFDSNGSGANYYEGNLAYNNGNAAVTKAVGIQDSWRGNGDTRPSSLVNNNAFGNKTAAYAKGAYTTTFSGNTETATSASPLPSLLPSPTPKPGDFNLDTLVNESDYSLWLTRYFSGGSNGVDYMFWVINYGT